jgi:hypothetical protein
LLRQTCLLIYTVKWRLIFSSPLSACELLEMESAGAFGRLRVSSHATAIARRSPKQGYRSSIAPSLKSSVDPIRAPIRQILRRASRRNTPANFSAGSRRRPQSVTFRSSRRPGSLTYLSTGISKQAKPDAIVVMRDSSRLFRAELTARMQFAKAKYIQARHDRTKRPAMTAMRG